MAGIATKNIDDIYNLLNQLLVGAGQFAINFAFTGWTKNGTAQTIVLPQNEVAYAHKIVRAYASLGTAPGTDKTLTLYVGSNELLSISGAGTYGEAENLNVPIQANTDIVIKAAETTGGAAANCNLTLWFERVF